MVTHPRSVLLQQIRMMAVAEAYRKAPDDELLVRFVTVHDEPAFAALLHRHGAMVLRVCHRVLGHAQDAEDAFQATFLVLALKAASIRKRHSLGPWLHGVAYRVARRARTGLGRQPVPELPTLDLLSGDQLGQAAWRELRVALDEELARLSEKHRAPLVLCYLEGQTQDEAARQLGWSLSTFKRRLRRARDLMRARLLRRGLTLGAVLFSGELAMHAATACVSVSLAGSTVRAATAVAAGEAFASVVPAKVAALVEGGLMVMFLAKLATVTAVLVAATLLAGAGVMFAAALAEPPDKKTDPAQGAGEPRATKADGSVWKEKAVLETPGWLPGSLAYSPDGKRLAVGGSGGKVTSFDAATWKPRWTADVGGNFAAVAFTSNGASLLATFRAGVRFVDPETGKLGKSIEEPDQSPDGRAIAVGVFPDRTVEPNLLSHQIVFGTPRGYVVKTWINDGPVSTLSVSTIAKGARPADVHAVPLAVDPNGRSAIMTGPVERGTGKNVLWAYVCGNYEKDSPGNRLLRGHQAIVVSAAWSKDGIVAVTGDAGGRVIVWDARTMTESRRLEFGHRIAALALTSDGRQTAAVVVGKQAEFHVWETAKPATDRKPLHVDTADYRGPIHASVTFSPDNHRLAGTVHNTVWLTRLGELIGKVHVWETASP